MTTVEKKSPREMSSDKMVSEIKGMLFGDLVKELVEFGDPKSIWKTGMKMKLGKMRHDIIVKELNDRFAIIEKTNNAMVEALQADKA